MGTFLASFYRLLLLSLVALTFSYCQNNEIETYQFKGMALEGALCASPNSTLIQVSNRNINADFNVKGETKKNILLAAIPGLDTLKSSKFLFQNKEIDLKKTIYFNAKEERNIGSICPAMFGLPKFQVTITKISNEP